MISLIRKLTLIILVISLKSFSQEPTYNSLDEFLNILETNNKLMATMAITKDNNEVYNKAVGYADLQKKIENTNTTEFRIGSITKAFTAVMIFQLIDEGRITLETPLSLFFPRIQNASEITIAHLLNHSSGLYNVTNDPKAQEWTKKTSSRSDMLERIKSHDLDFNPGEQTAYSNTNYIILGYIIEILDKDVYMKALDRRVVKKINLENTYSGNRENESLSYIFENESWNNASVTDLSNPGGAGAIVSTASDLTKFMNALFGGKLISASSLEAMKKTNNGEVCHGIFYANMNGIDLYASEGGIDGFQSMLAYIPSTKTAIALTANGLDYSKMRIMLTGLAASNGQPIVLPDFKTIELTETQAKLYEGEYASEDAPFKLIFKAEGNVLLGAPAGNDLRELTPTKQHQFKYENLGILLDFYLESGLMRYTEGDQSLLFKKQ